ncbi:pyridoxamine 5'-phosphate oxidase family protein [Caulobacter sp.]|uniref:pyridoxamine 5'-phosphate oxidase family protein n=1 Tax=Caulobacter sp. TaxID=78 RepID=UPI003BB10539
MVEDQNPPTAEPPDQPPSAEARVKSILARHHLMSVATLRPDGWPQTTLVNYLADGLSLYFLVAQESQKRANIAADPRVSIAIGGDHDGPPQGLSLAGRAAVIDDPLWVQALNRKIWGTPEFARFDPHPPGHAVVLLRFTPQWVSLIDYGSPPGRIQLFAVRQDWRLEPVEV